jgi:hypothetical protein
MKEKDGKQEEMGVGGGEYGAWGGQSKTPSKNSSQNAMYCIQNSTQELNAHRTTSCLKTNVGRPNLWVWVPDT